MLLFESKLAQHTHRQDFHGILYTCPVPRQEMAALQELAHLETDTITDRNEISVEHSERTLPKHHHSGQRDLSG